MEIRQLQYFVSVAQHLNFTKAAKQLFIAQPAVSQQIANLEKEMGVKLFKRDQHSVQLTPSGVVFLKEAIEIIKKSEEAVKKAIEAKNGVIGHINISFLSAAVKGFFPSFVKQFNLKYPNIELHLNHSQTGEIIEKLKSDEIDIAFTLSMGLQNIGGLESKVLFSVPHCVIVHDDHPLANKQSIYMKDLVEEKFVLLKREESPQGFDYILALCSDHGYSPNIVSQEERIETVLMLVEAGKGITILLEHLSSYASPSLQFKYLEDANQIIDIVACWKKSNTNPSLSLFIDELNTLEFLV